MADSSSEESENEFPELPPNVMLNIGLDNENNSDGHVSLTVISDETKQEECLPDVVHADDTSSSSSDSESDKGEIASNILNDDSMVQDRHSGHQRIVAGVKVQLEDRDEKVCHLPDFPFVFVACKMGVTRRNLYNEFEKQRPFRALLAGTHAQQKMFYLLVASFCENDLCLLHPSNGETLLDFNDLSEA